MFELELGWDSRATKLSNSSEWNTENIYESLELQGLLKNSLITRSFLIGIAIHFPEHEKVLTDKGLYNEWEFTRLYPLLDKENTSFFLNNLNMNEGGRKLFRLSSTSGNTVSPLVLVLVRGFPLNNKSKPNMVIISFLNEDLWKDTFLNQIPGNPFSGEFRLSDNNEVLLSFSTNKIPGKLSKVLEFPSTVLPGYYKYRFPTLSNYGNYKWARIIGIIAFFISLTSGLLFVRFFIKRNLNQFQPILSMISPAEQLPAEIESTIRNLLEKEKTLTGQLDKQNILDYLCANSSELPPDVQNLLLYKYYLVIIWPGIKPIDISNIEKDRIIIWNHYNGRESMLLWNGNAEEIITDKDILTKFFTGMNRPFGISSSVDSFKMLPDAKREAENQMEYYRFFNYRDTSPEMAFSKLKSPILLLNIWRHTKSGEWSSARKDTADYIEKIKEEHLNTEIAYLQVYALFSTIVDALGQLKNSNYRDFYNKILNLPAEFEENKILSMVDKRLSILFKELEQNYIEEEGQSGPWTIKVMDYMKSHFSDINLSVQSMAEDLETTSSYLSSIFRKESNSGLLDYIHMERLKQSIPLLNDKKKKLKQIAKAVGFASSNAYIRSFRKYTGLTPGAFRSLSGDEKWAINKKMEDSPPFNS
ncbi:helix-turn-helix transcriptional regulator [Oceanispirochaeta sp. M2]|nr:helix-turn-helix transcriptional regulator [Oceanispirochaeta sp. M2]